MNLSEPDDDAGEIDGAEPRRAPLAYAVMAAVSAVVLIVVMVVVLDSDHPVPGLQDARDRWEANGPSSYEMSYEVLGMVGTSSATVTVVDGVITDFGVAGDALFQPQQLTVQAVFDEIDDADDANRIEWHPEWGYPVVAWLDPHVDATDDEWRIRITSLDPIG